LVADDDDDLHEMAILGRGLCVVGSQRGSERESWEAFRVEARETAMDDLGIELWLKNNKRLDCFVSYLLPSRSRMS